MKPTLVFSLMLLAGCALPFRGSPQSEQRIPHMTADSMVASTIIQVRTYSGAPTVTVVAWDDQDAGVGLRGSVTRDGDVVGGHQRGDHQLYLAQYFGDNLGGFEKAAIMPAERKLAAAGGGRDLYPCYYGRNCSPALTRNLSIPDSLLRANRDSLVITFFPHDLESWSITLSHDLIDAYLRKVDSVVTSKRRIASR